MGEIMYIPFREMASMCSEPNIMAADIKMVLSPSEQKTTEGVKAEMGDIDT